MRVLSFHTGGTHEVREALRLLPCPDAAVMHQAVSASPAYLESSYRTEMRSWTT